MTWLRDRVGRLNLVDWPLIWDLAQIDILTIRVEMPIHHGLIVLEDADVAVVERQASATDCDVVHLVDPVMLSMPD